MMKEKTITIVSDRRNIVLKTGTILYVLMNRKYAEFHVLGDHVYKTRMTLTEIEEKLRDGFLKIHRGCLVSAMAVHDIKDRVDLSNGEALEYTVRKKKIILKELQSIQEKMIHEFRSENIPKTKEEYQDYYRSFDPMPFAFTDIEMVFDNNRRAIDWIFRYGNPALARLEKLPLERMIGNSFGSLFSNMDSKWCRSYERAALYGEKLEILDYSPEIDTYLKVTCFPTFPGHCGCILFDTSEIEFVKKNVDTEKIQDTEKIPDTEKEK